MAFSGAPAQALATRSMDEVCDFLAEARTHHSGSRLITLSSIFLTVRKDRAALKFTCTSELAVNVRERQKMIV